MTSIDMDDPNSPLSWIERILKTSKKVDGATTGALVAATGTSFVLGFVTGGLFWMPFGAFASVLGYRAVKYLDESEVRGVTRQIQIQEQIRIELEAIETSNIPQQQKDRLAQTLNNANVLAARNQRLLRQ